MSLRRTLLALALTVLAGNVTAQQLSPGRTGVFPVPANRIVGLWQVNVTIGACLGGPTQSFMALNNFHAGGTLSDFNVRDPSTRSPGMGIWEYQGKGQYKTRFQFYRFLPDGSFDGLQDIRTNTTLNAAGTGYSTTVSARVLNPDGSLRVELCGSANGERVAID